jgi:hypothetical protein
MQWKRELLREGRAAINQVVSSLKITAKECGGFPKGDSRKTKCSQKKEIEDDALLSVYEMVSEKNEHTIDVHILALVYR